MDEQSIESIHKTQQSEFLLLYEDVRQAISPELTLLGSFRNTYEAGVTLAQWDSESLEHHPAAHKGDRP